MSSTEVFTAFRKFLRSQAHPILFVLFLLGSLVIITNDRGINNQGAQLGAQIDDEPIAAYSPHSVLVKLTRTANQKNRGKRPDDISIPAIAQAKRASAVQKVNQVAKASDTARAKSPLFQWYELELDSNRPIVAKEQNGEVIYPEVEELLERLQNDPDIESAERNYLIQAAVIPDDPYFSSNGTWGQGYDDMWGLKRINTETAWDTTTGDSSVVVAIIDSGVDTTHVELDDQIWTNTAEIPGNATDDDGNGLVDDINGWDWYEDDNVADDPRGHGTHAAGTVAAETNNVQGVAGVAWGVKLMPLRILGPTGSGTLDDGAAGIQYAADMGADISSNSWGCQCESQLVDDAIQYSIDQGTIPISAAGNDYGDALDFIPGGSDGGITVGAIDASDNLASFSNDGPRVDVVAPGVDILSLKGVGSAMCTATFTINSIYCRSSGTSMATPHVAGVVALMKSVNPSLTTEQVRQILHTTAEDLGSAGFDTTYSHGVLDAAAAVSASSVPSVLTPEITSPSSRETISGSVTFTGSADGTDFQDYTLQAGLGLDPSSWTDVAYSTTPVTDGDLATFNTVILSDGFYQFRLLATNSSGDEYESKIYEVEVKNFTLQIDLPFNVIEMTNSIDIVGTADVGQGLAFDYYEIEYGEGATPASWSTTGIILENGGTSAVNSAKLASWDTSALADMQEYTLRIRAFETGGNSSEQEVSVATHSGLVSGWPKQLDGTACETFCRRYGSVFADLNGDGIDEIIVAGPQNTMYAFNRDGSNHAGWPVTISAGHSFHHVPVVGDVDGDLLPEVVIMSTQDSDNEKNYYIFRGDGTPHPDWPVRSMRSNVWSADNTPSLADIDEDGINEIVYWGFDDYVGTPISGYITVLNAFNVDGTPVDSFPANVGSSVTSWIARPPTIADIIGDSSPEIILAGYNRIAVFDSSGVVLPGWPVTIPDFDGSIDTIQGLPGVGDVDGDGGLEIVFNSVKNGGIFDDVRTHAYEPDGTLLAGWPYTAVTASSVGTNYQSVLLADIDEDGREEVILGEGESGVIDHETGPRTFAATRNSQRAVSIADFEGDGSYVIPGLYNAGEQWSLLSDLSQYWSHDFLFSVGSGGSLAESTIPVKDLDSDGALEWSYVLNSSDDELYAYLWEMQGTSSNPVDDWPQFGHDPARTSRFIVGQSPGDTTAPSVIITSPTDGATASGVVTINANATDDVGVDYVEFLVNGTVVNTDNQHPWSYDWDSSVETAGPYSLTARAYDAASNNATSSAVNVTVPDTIDPSVSITNPTDGSSVSGSVTVDVSASDNVAVDSVELLVNGSVIATDNAAPWSFNWDSSVETPGPYALTARAYDAANNNATSSAVNVTVLDSVSPSVSITNPTDGSSVSGSVTVDVSASDNVAVDSVELLIDGSVIATDSAAPWSFNWDSSVETPGPYTLTARAYDAASNNATSSAVNVTVLDSVDPSVSITVPSNGATVQEDITITANASDNYSLDRVEFWIAGSQVASGSLAPFEYNWDTSAETDGDYTLLARAYDSAGNSTDASITVTVDNPRVGDVDNDGDVDILDLSFLLSNYGTSASAADFNKNGTVDLLDLSALLSEYGT